MPDYRALYEESARQLELAKKFIYEQADEAMEFYHILEAMDANTEHIHAASRNAKLIYLAPKRKPAANRRKAAPKAQKRNGGGAG